MADPLGQSQVLPYLYGLSQKGHEIFLISFEKKQVRQDAIMELEDELEKNKIHWTHLWYTKKPPVLSTMLDVDRLKKKAKKIFPDNKIQIVHCRGYITALAGLWLKKKYNVRFLFDMRGFFADERVEGNLWNLKNPLYKWVYNYFKKKEKQFFIKADHIVSLTEKGKRIINDWKLVQADLPVTVIPCCADLDHFNYDTINIFSQESWRERLKIGKTDFIISYLGSIGTWYMPDEMLDFFNVLLAKRPEARFLFITAEPKEEIISAAVKKRIPAEQIIIQKASRSEVPLLLSLSNISVFFIKPVFSKSASSPTKMGEIMGMGIPLICNRNVGDINEIIDETKAGYAISDFNEKEYSDAVNRINNLLKIPKENIRESAKKYFSLSEGVEKYDGIYNQLSG